MNTGTDGGEGDLPVGVSGGLDESALFAGGFHGVLPGGVDAGFHVRLGEEVCGKRVTINMSITETDENAPKKSRHNN